MVSFSRTDKMCCVPCAYPVVMDFLARSARASLAHFPEIILVADTVSMIFGQRLLVVLEHLFLFVAFGKGQYKTEVAFKDGTWDVQSAQTYLEISGHNMILGRASCQP